jgi:thiamine transporter ThiT
VLRTLVRDPVGHMLLRWNWKAAVLSGSIRGAIFFTTNLTVSLRAATTALAVDLAFRLPLAGLYAALTQAFRTAEPAWAAALAAMVLVPLVAHSIEFIVHWMAGTPALAFSVAVSVAFSALSTLFNLFAMRRGVLVVGDASRPLNHDLRRMPAIVLEFVLALPAAVYRAARDHFHPAADPEAIEETHRTRP